jgi:hypothetical protein
MDTTLSRFTRASLQYLVYRGLRSALCPKMCHDGQHSGPDATTDVFGDRFNSFSGSVDEGDFGAFLDEESCGSGVTAVARKPRPTEDSSRPVESSRGRP